MRTIVQLTESKRAKVEPTRGGVLLTFEGRDQFSGAWYEGACFVLDDRRSYGLEVALRLARDESQEREGVAA